MTRRKLLQVCNVGRIVGGTAACAWTVTRALPEYEHRVVFLSPPDRETVAAFAPVPVSSAARVTSGLLAEARHDLVLLHNTPAVQWDGFAAVPTVLYLHSAITRPATADVVVCCSRWLARGLGLSADQVLWQAVPGNASLRGLRGASNRGNCSLIVGRICTPQARKWPRSVIPFYETLASRLPRVRWEFVGCPSALQRELAAACRGRVVFHSPGWEQRARLAEWDVLLYSNPELPESFGRTAAESMRAGCVPVVDRLGGFVEQIPSECGFLCSMPDDFAAALEQLHFEGLRRRYSEQAQRHADRWFSYERFTDDLEMWFDLARPAR